MKLYLAIKKVIDELGIDVFKSSVAVNVLADYGAYNDIPAIKQILKDLISQGYGNELAAIINASVDGQTGIKLQALQTKFIQQNGYKEDLVGYLFGSLGYAIGVTSIVPEYKVAGNVSKQPSSKTTGRISDLNAELIQLQSEYIEALNQLYESPNADSLALYGLYSAESNSKLWLIEQKIVIIYNALGQAYDNWCEQQKKRYLETKSKSRKAILTEKLEASHKNYLSLLTTLITVHKNIIYSKSGYYNESAQKTLEAEETTIGRLDKSLGTSVLQACLNEKQKTLEKYHQSFSRQAFMVALKIILPLVIITTSLYHGVTYLSSKDSIEQYNDCILSADKLMNDGAYIEAIALYEKAHDEYNGSYKTDSYKNGALTKKENACSKLLEQKTESSNTLFNSGKYKESLNELEAIKPYMITNQLLSSYNKTVTGLNTQIKTAVKRETNTIILNISTNRGKLDASGKKLLNSLLEVAPEDYWLNIIKTKQQK
jgi:hypothetical protein